MKTSICNKCSLLQPCRSVALRSADNRTSVNSRGKQICT